MGWRLNLLFVDSRPAISGIGFPICGHMVHRQFDRGNAPGAIANQDDTNGRMCVVSQRSARFNHFTGGGCAVRYVDISLPDFTAQEEPKTTKRLFV